MKTNDHLPYVLDAINMMEDNLQSEISVQTVTQVTTLPNWQFQRIFRAYVGDTIGNYLRIRRLTKAAEDLIAHPDRRVLDVAVDYQFGSQEAFARAFKAHFGVSPTGIGKSPELIRLLKKPRVTEEMLDHILVGLQKEPKIVDLPERHFVGIKTSILTPLGQEIDYTLKAPQLFTEFNQRRKEITCRIPELSFGIIIDPCLNMLSEELTYMATAQVTSLDDIPVGMESLTIGPQKYAMFENVGRADKTGSTIDYIYAIWLQGSSFKRAMGVDFEIFDRRYALKNPNSVSTYCIPIEPI